MTADPTILYEYVRGLAILVHGERPPTNSEWADYLASGERALSRSAKILVITDGVAPTPTQRAAMNKMVVEHGGDVATAVLSHSVAVRTVVALLSMWNRGIRSFSPGQLSQALQFLEVAPESRSEVLERVVRMRIQLSRNVSASEASVDLPKIADRMEALLLQRLPALRAGRKR